MWYKFNGNEWIIGNKVEFPNGYILHNNHNESFDGWNWYNEPPQEYLDWIEQHTKLNEI